MRAAIYCRISRDDTGRAAGVQRQEEDCRERCDREGWQVAGVYIDNDVSAFSGAERPEYRRLLEDVEAGQVQAVVAWHPDRLHRSPVELEEFIALVDRMRTRVVTISAGEYDLSSATGRMTARVVGAVARQESEQKSERIRRSLEQVAEEGRPANGGYRPFGYGDDRVTLVPEEAELLREATRRILAGESVRGVRLDWNERGVRTVAGNEWSTTTIMRMLRSPRIAGLRQHRGKVVGEAVWPAIISPHEHEQLVAKLARKRGQPARSYLLSGMVTCGRCGATLASKRSARKDRQYWCHPDRGCSGLSIQAAPLERIVRDALFLSLDGPALVDARRQVAGNDVRLGVVADRLAADEEALETLARDRYVERTITDPEYRTARAALVERIEDARRELAHDRDMGIVAALPPGEGALEEAWKQRGLEWCRALLAAVLESLVVQSATPGASRVEPERVELRWRV